MSGLAQRPILYPVPRASIQVSTGFDALRDIYDWQSDCFIDPSETTATWAMLKARPQAWYQKWWVWTIVGAVAAGAGATTLYLTKTPPPTGSGHVVAP